MSEDDYKPTDDEVIAERLRDLSHHGKSRWVEVAKLLIEAEEKAASAKGGRTFTQTLERYAGDLRSGPMTLWRYLAAYRYCRERMSDRRNWEEEAMGLSPVKVVLIAKLEEVDPEGGRALWKRFLDSPKTLTQDRIQEALRKATVPSLWESKTAQALERARQSIWQMTPEQRTLMLECLFDAVEQLDSLPVLDRATTLYRRRREPV